LAPRRRAEQAFVFADAYLAGVSTRPSIIRLVGAVPSPQPHEHQVRMTRLASSTT
jgi:hypothetical protein